MDRYELIEDLPNEKRGGIWVMVGNTIQSEDTGNSLYLKDLIDFNRWFSPFSDNWIPYDGEVYYYLDILYNNYQSGFFVKERFNTTKRNCCRCEVEQCNFFKTEIRALAIIEEIDNLLLPFRDYFSVKINDYYYSICKSKGSLCVKRYRYVIGGAGMAKYSMEINGEKQTMRSMHKSRKHAGNFFDDIKVAKIALNDILKILKNK